MDGTAHTIFCYCLDSAQIALILIGIFSDHLAFLPELYARNNHEFCGYVSPPGGYNVIDGIPGYRQ